MVQLILNLLKKCDLHGHPVSFTFKNKITYQSAIGGIVTILSRIGILVYFLVLLMKILDKESKVTFKSNYKTANLDVQEYPLETNNFDIAFTIGASSGGGAAFNQKVLNLAQYMKFEYSYTESYLNETSPGVVEKVRKSHIVGDTNCTSQRFAGLNGTMTSIGINNAVWRCINNLGFTLKGQYPSTTRTLMKLRMVPCTNTSTIDNITCAPQTEIDSFISSAIVNVALLSSYFDQDEFSGSPVKNDINLLIYNVKQGQGFTQVMNVKKHIVQTKDYWFSNFLNNKAYEFYQVNEQKIMVGEIKSGSFDMFQMMFYCANEEIEIERVVVTFTDILATAGGFSSIIFFFTRMVSKLYAQLLYELKLTKKLFKVNKQTDLNNNYSQKRLFPQDLNESKNQSQQLKDKVWEAFQSRISPKIQIKIALLNQYFSLFCPRLKRENESIIWRNGQYMIQKQLDIVNVLKQIRKMKVATKLILKNYQYDILKYSSKGTIPIRDITNKRSKAYQSAKSSIPHTKDFASLGKVLKCNNAINRKIVEDFKQQFENKSLFELSKIKEPKKDSNDQTYLCLQPPDSSKNLIKNEDISQLEEFHTVESPMSNQRKQNKAKRSAKLPISDFQDLSGLSQSTNKNKLVSKRHTKEKQ